MKQLCLSLVFLCACAGGEKPTLKTAISAAIISVDAAYGLAVETCDAKEKEIATRKGSTREKDVADMTAARAICDNIYATFEQARTLAPMAAKLEGL